MVVYKFVWKKHLLNVLDIYIYTHIYIYIYIYMNIYVCIYIYIYNIYPYVNAFIQSRCTINVLLLSYFMTQLNT